jgi:DNA polymerase III delta subunit
MLYILVGTTAQKYFLKKSSGLLSEPRRLGRPDFLKNTPVSFSDLKWENLSIEELVSLASTQNMFGENQIYVLVGAINSDRQEEFLEIADALQDSPNTFIFEEEKLLKGPTTALEKAGAEIVIEKRPSAAGKERGFDPFGLTFALAAKDRKKLWLGLTAAFKAGEKAEAIAGLLLWKVRQMQDVKLSRELTFMYHDSHRGAGDLELLLERFALRL